MDGSIPIIQLCASDSVIETILVESASLIGTISELVNIMTNSKDKEAIFLRGSVARRDAVTDSRIVEVTDRMESYSSPVYKQALHGAASNT